MIDPKKIGNIVGQIRDVLPQAVVNMSDEAEKKVKRVLQNQFSKLDMVTLEEFEVQKLTLQRTQEKLTALESRVNELEAKLAEK